jgi:nascent polypeptide-associated complex subunit alpha
MLPGGINPRQMRMAMKKLGIQQEELEAEEVIIRLKDRELVISNPQVSKVNMMGQETYQVVGEAAERSLSSEPDISDEDVKTVAESAGVSVEKALDAIKKNGGDLAAAILELKE